MAIYRGEELVMKPSEHLKGPDWADQTFWSGYRMDLPHRYPGTPAPGSTSCTTSSGKASTSRSSDRVLDPSVRGFGHAFGFVIERLMKDVEVPMLPVMLNTYFRRIRPRRPVLRGRNEDRRGARCVFQPRTGCGRRVRRPQPLPV
jgi:hypothetical protein